MSTSVTHHVRYNLQLLALLLLLLPVLACKALTPSVPTSAPETEEGTRVMYPTGIETVRFDDGVIVVVDHKGSYAMGFQKQWEVGAFHEDFVPTVAKDCEIHAGVCSLFQGLYENDTSARIYAIDASPSHLTKDNMAVLHVGMFQDERLKLTIEELAAQYTAYLDSTGRVKITDTLSGTSNHGIPFAILLTEPISITDSATYGAQVLIKTDQVYLEMIYTTTDKTINIVDELLPTLGTLTTDIE